MERIKEQDPNAQYPNRWISMTADSSHINLYFWLLLIAFAVALVTRKAKIPYALALVITGLVIGIPRLLPQGRLEPHLLFTVFLPPLLFETALNLRSDPLRRDWKPITIYTLGGTVASTFIVGWLVHWTLQIPLSSGLVFGALISATDPIAVIAIFKRLGAGQRLTLIIEAESLFNDGVAAVLFAVALAAAGGAHVSLATSLWQVCLLIAGGTLTGAVIGGLASRLHYELDDHLVEITLTTVVAFGAYVAAEALHVSGVMAVVAAGFVIGNYGMPNTMSPGTRLAVSAFWEYAAFVVNSIVFLLIGIEMAYVHWQNRLWQMAGAVLIVLAGRAAIYPLSLLVNRLRGAVPRAWQHVLFWGGLRGALSMALVLGLSRDFPQRDTLVAITFGVVLFSLLAQGSTIGGLLRRLELAQPQQEQAQEQRQIVIELVACQAALDELNQIRAQETHPNWAIELLTQRYRTQVADLEATLQALQPDYRARSREQAQEAQRRVLAAEKSAFQEAERQGWLTAHEWGKIAARLDAQLDELLANRGEH
jgi:CPA1 family monovalent cation:H+ antiporter